MPECVGRFNCDALCGDQAQALLFITYTAPNLASGSFKGAQDGDGRGVGRCHKAAPPAAKARLLYLEGVDRLSQLVRPQRQGRGERAPWRPSQRPAHQAA